MTKVLRTLWKHVARSARDLAPIILVIGFFQHFILEQPLDNSLQIFSGAIMVLLGLTLFVYGLELALFPIGESLAFALARKGSVFWLLTFAFLLGFGTTVAEPALTAVANEAAQVAAAAGAIGDTDEARARYVLGLRRHGHRDDRCSTAGDCRYRLRLGRRHHVHRYRAAGRRTRRGDGVVAPRPQPDDGRFRPDRVRFPDTHGVRHGLREYRQVDLTGSALETILSTAFDVLPIVLFIFLFQVFVIRQPIRDVKRLLVGLVFTILGLGLFLVGLEQALFPLGRLMAQQLTHPEFLLQGAEALDFHWSNYTWVYVFAFAIGFATTIAEPALLAVAMKANETSGGAIHVWGLRVAVAIGAAVGVSLGCFRIIAGLPLQAFILAGYIIVVVQTIWAPRLIIPLAYDSGGVTTSTVTVPLVAALGLGLAETVPGRSPLLDGFGLVAFTCLFPIISVLAYAQLSALREQLAHRRKSRQSHGTESTSKEAN
jgi:hypothetical protein